MRHSLKHPNIVSNIKLLYVSEFVSSFNIPVNIAPYINEINIDIII